MSVDVKPGAAFEAGAPRLLFQPRVPSINLTTFRNHYTVSPDGQKFVVVTVPQDQSMAPLVVVLNWMPRTP